MSASEQAKTVTFARMSAVQIRRIHLRQGSRALLGLKVPVWFEHVANGKYYCHFKALCEALKLKAKVEYAAIQGTPLKAFLMGQTLDDTDMEYIGVLFWLMSLDAEKLRPRMRKEIGRLSSDLREAIQYVCSAKSNQADNTTCSDP